MRYRRLGGASGVEVSGLCLGAMFFGTSVDEQTSFAILDRFVAAGGTFVDTANNYAFWKPGGTGDESETVLGRWLADRGARNQVRLATKVGARPLTVGAGRQGRERLTDDGIRSALRASLRRLRTDHVDVYYPHVEDHGVALEEIFGTLSALVEEGVVRAVGASNHRVWRMERARAAARSRGWTPLTCVQQRYSYFQPRPGRPLVDAGHMHVTEDVLDYVRNEPELTLVAYMTLLAGRYTRSDRPMDEAYLHVGNDNRRSALRDVARRVGATPNQVVLAWLAGGDPPVLPLVGVSSVAQLDEVLDAMELTLDEECRARLDGAA